MKTFNNRAKIKLLSSLLVLLFAFSLNTFSQVFYSNGANVYIEDSTIIRVRGTVQIDTAGTLYNFENNAGETYGEFIIDGDFIIGDVATVTGDGIYKVSGDWENNGTFSSGTSNVILEDTSATDQLITGSVITSFNNLELTGGGIKTQTINSSVTGVLALNDRELATDDYIMFVENTDVSAITFIQDSGFVSSTGDGCLSRETAYDSTYVFPVGSSLITTRYRPVEITPSSNPHTYTVRLANNDANNDGYYRDSIDVTICVANPEFYHRINRTSGSDAADIAIYYDETADGPWEGIAQWDIPLTEWVDVGTVTVTSAVPLSSITKSNWDNFTTDPYILIKASIYVDLGPDTSTCEGGTVTLIAPGGYSYEWTDGFTNQTLDVDSSGTYYVTVTDTTSGCTGTDAINVAINTNPTVDLGADQFACDGDIVPLDAGPGYSYEWTGSFTSQTINVTTEGMYNVTITDGNGCQATDSAYVTFNTSPVVDLGPDTTVCDGNIITLDAGPGPGYTYIWDDASSTTTQTLDATAADTYSVTVTIGGICPETDAINVTFASTPLVDLGSDREICLSETNILDPGSAGDTYLWDDGTTLQTLNVTTDGIYSVTVTATNLCGSSSDSLNFTVHPLPTVNLGPDIGISGDTTIILDAENPGADYIWSTGDTTQTITVSEEGTYWVIVTDSNGCTITGSVIIIIEKPEFIIYNTFTPNGDGYNDTWQIETIELYPGNTVEIYNRNGNLVYKNEEGKNMWKWDGKYYIDGIDLPAASYYYIIDLNDGRMFTGVIAIVR